jgi:hypothetical protein
LEPASVLPVQAVLVFTHDQLEINVSEAPLPAVHMKKLKDFMRQQSGRLKEVTVSQLSSRE